VVVEQVLQFNLAKMVIKTGEIWNEDFFQNNLGWFCGCSVWFCGKSLNKLYFFMSFLYFLNFYIIFQRRQLLTITRNSSRISNNFPDNNKNFIIISTIIATWIHLKIDLKCKSDKAHLWLLSSRKIIKINPPQGMYLTLN